MAAWSVETMAEKLASRKVVRKGKSKVGATVERMENLMVVGMVDVKVD